jgi:hypothetical protein
MGGGAEPDHLAGDLDLAGVRADHPGEDPDQGALAGAVRADQRVDLARRDREVDRAEGLDGPVPLGDPADAEQVL